MRQFQILAHTADVRLKLQGDNPQELFTAGLEAISEILGKNGIAGQQIVDKLSLNALDETALLIEFLSEIVSRAYLQKVIFTQVIFEEFSPKGLKAKICGTPVTQFAEDIKAVTYHEAKIVKNNQGIYETTVVLDI